MYLVVAQQWVALRLDPDSGHRVVEDLIVLYDSQASVVHENAAVLPTPDLVLLYVRVASRSTTTTVRLEEHQLIHAQ